uniref:Uncharacterized protein n=1 Tax=Arabidopsis thaliana TaxID=3702 RepID=Q8LCG2_ARATH|nr:unknown [Arabidopsis thaliana]
MAGPAKYHSFLVSTLNSLTKPPTVVIGGISSTDKKGRSERSSAAVRSVSVISLSFAILRERDGEIKGGRRLRTNE